MEEDFYIGDVISAEKARSIASGINDKKLKDVRKIIFSKIYNESRKGLFKTEFNLLNDFGISDIREYMKSITQELKKLGFTVETKELEYKTDYLTVKWQEQNEN